MNIEINSFEGFRLFRICCNFYIEHQKPYDSNGCRKSSVSATPSHPQKQSPGGVLWIKCSSQKISQNSQENTFVGVFFLNKVSDLKPATFLKKSPWLRFFPVNFAKFLRIPFYRTPLSYCFWAMPGETFTSLNEQATDMWVFNNSVELSSLAPIRNKNPWFSMKMILRIINTKNLIRCNILLFFS